MQLYQLLLIFSLFKPSRQAKEEDAGQCVGLGPDLARLKALSKTDLQHLIHPDEDRAFSSLSDNYITVDAGSNQITAPQCIGRRYRFQESLLGMPVFGAEFIVTVDARSCNSADARFFDPSGVHSTNVLGLLPESSVQSIHGHTFAGVEAPAVYATIKTEDEAVEFLKEQFDVPKDAIGDVSLEMFISTGGDFPAYFAHVLVEKNNGAELYHVSVNANDLSIIFKCTLTSGQYPVSRRRRLGMPDEGPSHSRQSALEYCERKSISDPVSWTSDFESCQIHSLYLDDVGKKTICTVGKNENTGERVVGPGPVAYLYWMGALDCNGTNTCQAAPLPSESDALSDAQFGGVKVMQFLQEKLQVMGGLNKDAQNPVPVTAMVHYEKEYCNAFYSPSSNNVHFGDCNCKTFLPLVALDIVAHEIGHGVTRHSSKLAYSGESGGLNEGFSDIFGTSVEFDLNDYNDQPDFTIAEMMGRAIRNMENPMGRSLGTICEYFEDESVHYSSGILNKAFVKSVRSCVNSSCGDLRHCTVLLGRHFLYTNINGLTPLSTFDDAAESTCLLVEEVFTVLNLETQCTAAQVKNAVKAGWDAVDIVLEDGCSARRICGSESRRPTSPPSPSPTFIPTLSSTLPPTSVPSSSPTLPPTPVPTPSPTQDSAGPPTSSTPTTKPTGKPTSNPTNEPTFQPTGKPTFPPTDKSTSKLTGKPTQSPVTPAPAPDQSRLPVPAPAPDAVPQSDPDEEDESWCSFANIGRYWDKIWAWW